MSGNIKSLVALAVGCTFAAAIFGFSVEVFSWRGSYAGDMDRVQLIQLTRVVIYVARGDTRVPWRLVGALVAISMVFVGAAIECAPFPFSADWTATVDPSGYGERFGAIQRRSYLRFAIFGIDIVAGLTRGLRMMAHVNPRGPRDE